MKFFFNDCLPQNRSLAEYTGALHRTICAYKELSTKHEICLVSATHQDSLPLAPAITLKQCILELSDRTERTYALRLFNKYPIGALFDEQAFEDKLLENRFGITIEGEERDALNLALVGLNNCMLFTLGLNDELRQNCLLLVGKTENCEIDNLYGEAPNTIYINDKLDYIKEESKTLLEKLSDIIGRPVQMRDTFKSDFESIGETGQQSILEKFDVAKRYDMLCPVKADEKTIRDVTPETGPRGLCMNCAFSVRPCSVSILRKRETT